MRVALHFESEEAALKMLEKAASDLREGMDAVLDVELESSDGFNTQDRTLRFEVINEGNDEFAAPTASLHRD